MKWYTAPLRDMAHVLHEVLRVTDWLNAIPAQAGLDAALIDQTLAGAARFAEDVLAPLNAGGDQFGSRLEADRVTTAPGFAAAYRQYVEDGWPTLSCPEADGGQGLPALMHSAVLELLCGANASWTMVPILSHGCCAILSRHGAPALRERWLPDMVSGAVTTTMGLTEAHCGSDLGLLRSRAEPDPDAAAGLPGAPAYRLHGSKIFISGADHDWTGNIVHFVLARLPDAPPGVRGISLFLVPKRLRDADGRDADDNAVRITAVEHKMGLKASPTCAISFEGARGWLVGAPHQGLAAMFILMNDARLNVGVQALAIAQGAFDAALGYARERLQMRAAGGAVRPDLPADPIIHHADVRRMLLTQKSRIEAARMLTYGLALCSDLEAGHPDEAVRHEAGDLLALLTPVAKAFASDHAFEDCNLALQVYGGHGYLRDHGVEQRVRDVRIAQIYEGTNGVQARDLVNRKILGDGGKRLRALLARIRTRLAADGATPELAPLAAPVARLADDYEAAVAQLAAAAPQGRDAAAHDLLQALGHLCYGALHVRSAAVSRPHADDFHAAKAETARHYITQLLPRAEAHLAAAVAAMTAAAGLDEARLFG